MRTPWSSTVRLPPLDAHEHDQQEHREDERREARLAVALEAAQVVAELMAHERERTAAVVMRCLVG